MVDWWRDAEKRGYNLDEGMCSVCLARHAPGSEVCPNDEARKATIEECGVVIVTQARAILRDARAYKKRRNRPPWSPVYDQLVDMAIAVEAEYERAQEHAKRPEEPKKPPE